MHILVVEDNETIALGLKYLLENEHFLVTLAFRGKDALRELNQEFALIILDLSLPDYNDFALANIIRRRYKTPIIFLTAKDDEDAIVKGLEIGDDYLTKPFKNRELLMRIKKIIKKQDENQIISFQEFILDNGRFEVCKEDKVIPLTSLEYKILLYLVQNINHVVSLENLLDYIYEITGNYVNDNTLRVYIKRIREKMGKNDVIKTIKGLGYRIDET